MSRILRRPMFRGGGTVDSYGTGIAAPLVPGYRMGGNVRGGIVDLPGGYDLTANERFLNSLNKDFGRINVGTSAGSTAGLPEITLGADLMAMNNVPPSMRNQDNIPGTTKENDGNSEEIVTEDFSDLNIDLAPPTVDYEKIPKYITNPDDPNGVTILNPEYVDNKNILNEIFGGPFKKKGESFGKGDEIIKSDVQDANKDMKSFPRDVEDMGAETDATLIGGDEDGSTGELGEATEMTAKDAIAQNQALFAELLGADKARGQDIGDMLLRFSGSQGNTVGEKFQNYTRAESAAGPSRSEKIKQTAAGLAINDYVAGKRSKEQIEALKTKIDYTQDKKNAALQLTVNDDLSMAKAKASKLTDKGINSDETTKALIQTKVGTGVPVFRAQIKFKDVEKKKDKLKQGYNLVDDEGTTRIVIYDGNNVNVVGTIDEFWSS